MGEIMKNVVVGVDIGGTNTVFGLVDENGNIIARDSLKTGSYSAFESFVEAVSQVIEKFQSEYTEYKIITVGIGAPDANYYTGNIEHAANLKWSGIVPLASSFEKRLKLPVVITNDANAATLGEKLFGGAKESEHFAMITLGTGLGSGFVIDNTLLYGRGSLAGEVGHQLLVPDGRKCGCGRRGCSETYVSATGMVRTAIEVMSDWMDDSVLRDFPVRQLSSKKVFTAAKNGDLLAIEVFRRTAEHLGQVLVDTMLFSNPDTIFLFGGLANAGDFLLQPLREIFERRSLEGFRGSCKIEISELPEADAAILGSAALGWEEFHK